METSPVTKVEFIERLRKESISLFTPDDVVKLFFIKNKNTLKHLLMRLTKDNIIEPLTRGKYAFPHAIDKPSDFQIANFLVVPSYVSLESALSLYGIIEQFPYRVTSVTVKKTKEFQCRGKIFSYSKIKPVYFKDFIREENYLIASKEKALFDFTYLVYNGLRSKSRLKDLKKDLRKPEARKYLQENSVGRFQKFIQKYA